MKPSGIGGQAVIEGIMMRNKNVYSVAIRKPDNEIEVVTKERKMLTETHKWMNLPIIRGVFNFAESLIVGTSTLSYSSSFYEDPKEQKPTAVDDVAKSIFKDKLDSVIMAATILMSIILALVLFMLAPYMISRLLSSVIVSQGVLNLIEGLVRVAIFILYILLISLMKDIKRTFMYHGAEHKCINCIENGLELNVENVRISSREHKRCGTSFIFLVMFISVILFIFIHVENPFLQIGIRILLIPVIAGLSYEFIRLAGRTDNVAIDILSKPGMWLQKLTTKEPDDEMIEVGIKAVEAVFDWRTFLEEYYDEIDTDGIMTTEESIEDAAVATSAEDADASEVSVGEAIEGEAAEEEAAEEEVSEEQVSEEKFVAADLADESELGNEFEAKEAKEESYVDEPVDSDLEEDSFAEEDKDENASEEAAEYDTAEYEAEESGSVKEYKSHIQEEEPKYDEYEEDTFEEKPDTDLDAADALDASDDLEDDGIEFDMELSEAFEPESEELPDESKAAAFEFVDDDEDDDEVGIDVPIFKQRKTDISANDRKRR